MKIFKTLIFLITLFISLTSCDNKSIKEPEQIGHQAFKLLKQFDKSNQQDYLARLLPIEKIRKIDKSLKKINIRKRTLQNQMWLFSIKNDYNRLKEKGHRYGINWQLIKYQKFVLDSNINKDAKTYHGVLYFGFNKGIFKIMVEAIYDKEDLKLTRLKGLFKQ